jgi:hypothetical protein
MLTVPETEAPFVGEVIVTAPLGVGVAVGVEDALDDGVDVGVGVCVGVAVAPPFWTVTVTEEVPITVLLELYALAEIVWLPFGTVVESQLKVNGGDDLKYLPSM